MDSLFFQISKVAWLIVSPDHLFLALLSLSLLFIVYRPHPVGHKLLKFLVSSLILLSIFSVGEWMLYPLEARFKHNPQLPAQIDGIIVLGGSIVTGTSKEWEQFETNQYHERLSSFIELAARYPEARLVFTGGNASLDPDHPTEAQFARTYLLKTGIDEKRLYIEDRARNTAENASLTKRLMKPQAGENWLLITTAFHMPRSIGAFCQQGWKVIPYPVDHQTVPSKLYNPGFNLLGNANTLLLATHEWLGLLAYYLSGKTAALLPQQCGYSN